MFRGEKKEGDLKNGGYDNVGRIRRQQTCHK